MVRAMKSAAERPSPTTTLTTMSKATVKPKQASSTAVSLLLARLAISQKCLASLIFQAVTSNRPDSAGRGK